MLKLSDANRARWAIALLTLSFGAYFFGGAASNQNARLDAIYAFVEPGTPDTGTFRIDRFMVSPTRSINTLDWAAHEGHYYANKAPGTIWLGALAYKPLVLLASWFGGSFDDPGFVIASAYLINLFVSVLPLVAAALALFEFARRRGLSLAHASLLALATTLGTPWFPYSTQLWGHTTAAAFIALALVQVQKGSRRALVLAGALLGLSVCTDYLALLAALGIGALVLSRNPRQLPALLLGALPLALALLGYHTICFGGPFVTASEMSNARFLEADRALGMFGQLSWHALWELTFGLRRGLFLQCPVLLLSLFGFYAWVRRTPRDPLAWLCILMFVGYLVINASFNGWHGGATVSARYLIVALPFLGLSLHALPWSSRAVRIVFGLTSIVSVVNMTAIAAVNPLAPEELTNPLYGYTYGLLFDGQVSPYPFAFKFLMLHPEWKELTPYAMWNLGELLGLRGLWSLLPLLLTSALLVSFGAAWIGLSRREQRA